MAEKPNIDYAHASALLDTVQKVATIAPRYTNLGQLAMAELKDMDEAAKTYHDEVAKELAAEQAKKREDEQARQDTEAKANAPRVIPAKNFEPTPDLEPTPIVERRV